GAKTCVPPVGQFPPSRPLMRPAFAAGTENAAAARTAGRRYRKRATTEALSVDRRCWSHLLHGNRRNNHPSEVRLSLERGVIAAPRQARIEGCRSSGGVRGHVRSFRCP